MLKDIASIEISGANFSAPTFLNLFEPTEGNKIKIVKGSLLYGRNFFSFISDSEKQRTARDILCLIYLLNKQHLLAHLEDIDCNAKATLDSWCLDIRNRSVAV